MSTVDSFYNLDVKPVNDRITLYLMRYDGKGTKGSWLIIMSNIVHRYIRKSICWDEKQTKLYFVQYNDTWIYTFQW